MRDVVSRRDMTDTGATAALVVVSLRSENGATMRDQGFITSR